MKICATVMNSELIYQLESGWTENSHFIMDFSHMTGAFERVIYDEIN
jgi:hypothetical protein